VASGEEEGDGNSHEPTSPRLRRSRKSQKVTKQEKRGFLPQRKKAREEAHGLANMLEHMSKAVSRCP
jgi:hypothetical protein